MNKSAAAVDSCLKDGKKIELVLTPDAREYIIKHCPENGPAVTVSSFNPTSC